MVNFSKLCETVQHNCHISDSLHAQDYGLCIYLLKMRQFYRWEKHLSCMAEPSHQAISEWLGTREQLWKQFVDMPFSCIPIDDECYDPFDTSTINQFLLPQGIVYSGGYGKFCKPLFFVGLLSQYQQRDALEILIVGKEYARDLMAPVAMTQGNTIIVRKESLRQATWEKIEEWRWQKKSNPYWQHLAAIYSLDQDIENALETMCHDQLDMLIDHELGEVQAGQLLGQQWEAMLLDLSGHQAEWVVRAVRDHIADCLVTLPTLLEKSQTTHLLFYFFNLTGVRKTLFPALVQAYQGWLENTQDLVNLKQIVLQGQTHWLTVARTLLQIYRHNPQNSAAVIYQKTPTFSF